ncbi:hypothetical protein HOLleu_06216 [Holothuria leucospilota]|uniref:Uncharacterized protein n=1 Tax=Holothuria leucospilota TaxID=206669 RepID=A0A9Q1CMR2_HOLLE|nr:hypothetical protein HOLleu_06216 [Holothuria leucospilota]
MQLNQDDEPENKMSGFSCHTNYTKRGILFTYPHQKKGILSTVLEDVIQVKRMTFKKKQSPIVLGSRETDG